MEQVTVVVGGQAGSEGKGAITARLHRDRRYDWAVRVGGPNAGHTVVHSTRREARPVALRQLPVAAIADPLCNLVIAAGSEIDPAVLQEEIDLVEGLGIPVHDRLYVDREATIIDPEFGEIEQAVIGSGTTGKGIGVARAMRALRWPDLKRAEDLEETWSARVVDTQALLWFALEHDKSIMIEGTQGYKLGSHAGAWPHVTSGDCRAIDMLAMAGLPPQDTDTWVVLRSYPIRIAGNSGPLEHETTWEEIGVPPEFTTVTKKMRRVGEWNEEWARQSVRLNSRPNRPASLAITFADYWWPHLTGRNIELRWTELPGDMYDKLYHIQAETGGKIRLLGTGPDTQIGVR